MGAKHLVIVPHTHWDREWYMPFESFRKRLVLVMDHLMEVMEKDDTFKYFELDGQTAVLNDYLEIRPENEGRLKKLIRKGRLLVGPWYIQPDEFLVTGESLIRNLRMGIRLAQKFGKASMVGYMPDQFGHIAQMPQLLSGFGIRSAVVYRGVGDTVNRTQFLWESPDGTRIFSIYLPDSYANGESLPLRPKALKDRLVALIKRQGAYSDVKSILIMNGGDHLGLQAGLPDRLGAVVQKMGGATFEMGNLDMFIKQVQEQADSLSVHRGEFRSSKRIQMTPGVSSVRVRQKQRDFYNCRLLEKYVEPLCTWANLCGDGRPYRDFLEYAWRLTIENHPHDSICGCSLDVVHEEMDMRFEKVRQLAESLQNDAFSFLANHLDSYWAEPDAPVLCVYNPTATERQVVDIVADLEEPDFVNSVRDRHGRIIPIQKTVGEREVFFATQAPPDMIREQVQGMEGQELLGLYINNILWRRDAQLLNLNLIMGHAPAGEIDIDKRRKELLGALSDPSIETVDIKGVSGARTRISFLAEGLSPLGLSMYSLCEESDEQVAGKRLAVSPKTMENDYYRVSVNEDGTLDILDKQSRREYLRCVQFVDEGDRGDEYNFDEVPGAEIVDAPAGAVGIAVEETGPIRASLKIEARFRFPRSLSAERDSRSTNYVESIITTRVAIYRDIKRIDFCTTLDNHVEDHRLRVVFNAPFACPEAVVETTFGTVMRPSKVEAGEGYFEKPINTSPQKTFSCVEDGAGGMALFNRGIPEVEAIERENSTALALTLLRSVGWLSREDLGSRTGPAGPLIETPGAQSKGGHTFEYGFTTYRGDYGDANIAGQAHSFAFPPIAMVTNRHRGKVKGGLSFAGIDNPNVTVSALEPSGTDGGYCIRVYNTAGSPQAARLTPSGKGFQVYAVDFLMKRLTKRPFGRKSGAVELSFRPFEIKTLELVPKR